MKRTRMIVSMSPPYAAEVRIRQGAGTAKSGQPDTSLLIPPL